ncbi:type IVB secretion system protein IcmH/DotU [Thalassobius sp. S69A]|uniref:type IVB secretion system protein IcmH/DotU n=1 Tax=unclassified Thalassovita TaxID=2619711 RepID=UPI000C10537B|nr:type VI secretion system protein TssL [Paracoccaceae bacterium]MBT25695.1 type VI secretion system protein TssL [Paracoccaceae bacterium]
MTDDDPFAEPTDTDKTVIRLNPGGRRLDAAPPPPSAAPAATPAGQMPPPVPPSASSPVPEATSAPHGAASPRIDSAATGLNPLNAAATPLFLLVGRIRNRAQHSDPAALRESVVAEIRAFETRAGQAGIPAQTIRVARYAICATIDDVVLNTPWGGQSLWARQSMVGTFHKETHGGDRFYDLLDKLQSNPAGNRDLLEFLYMCLSLGFEGRLRVEPRGSERHLAIRDGLARAIRTQRGQSVPDLSPHWRGVHIAHRTLSAWMPIWLFAGVTVALISVVFFGLSFVLSLDTERLRGQFLSLDLSGPVELARPAPPPPPPPEPVVVVQQVSIREFLAAEVAEGLVTVETDANTVTIRINGAGMFGSASDVLAKDFGPIIDRVATALENEAGRIIVAGHSDNIPINTARFPSNTFLSLARARAVMARMTPLLSDPTRIVAEGRADREPIAPNDTAAGRALNRRIDVILVKSG